MKAVAVNLDTYNPKTEKGFTVFLHGLDFFFITGKVQRKYVTGSLVETLAKELDTAPGEICPMPGFCDIKDSGHGKYLDIYDGRHYGGKGNFLSEYEAKGIAPMYVLAD